MMTPQKYQKGFSLIELTVFLVIFGILMYFLNPFSFVQVFSKNSDSVSFEQTGRAVFTKFSQLTRDSASVEDCSSDSITLNTESGTYHFYVKGSLNDSPPYPLVFQKNGGSESILAEGIAKLSTPDRKGFEVTCRTKEGDVATATQDIAIIDIKLSFAKEKNTFSTHSSFHLDSKDKVIDAK